MKHMVASPKQMRNATHGSGLKADGIFRYRVNETRMETLRLSLLNDYGHETSRMWFYTALSRPLRDRANPGKDPGWKPRADDTAPANIQFGSDDQGRVRMA